MPKQIILKEKKKVSNWFKKAQQEGNMALFSASVSVEILVPNLRNERQEYKAAEEKFANFAAQAERQEGISFNTQTSYRFEGYI